MSEPTPYPNRNKTHHAHKLTRLLFKSCAVQHLGHAAVNLIIHIAHTEDAARYQYPVTFWNCQLESVLGFTSPKQLNTARKKAIDAGWLVYERANDRACARYWTTIPSALLGFDDAPIEEMLSQNGKVSESGKDSQNGKESDDMLSVVGKESGKHCGKESGKPPTLSLSLSLNHSSCAQVADMPDQPTAHGCHSPPESTFEEFWSIYPFRTLKSGRRTKGDKQEAMKAWNRLSGSDRSNAVAGAKVLADADQWPKDAERFLSKRGWGQWLESEQRPISHKSTRVATPDQLKNYNPITGVS